MEADTLSAEPPRHARLASLTGTGLRTQCSGASKPDDANAARLAHLVFLVDLLLPVTRTHTQSPGHTHTHTPTRAQHPHIEKCMISRRLHMFPRNAKLQMLRWAWYGMVSGCLRAMVGKALGGRTKEGNG